MILNRATLLLFIIIISCRVSKNNENVSVNTNDANDSIYFFVLKMSKDSIQGKNVIELVSKTKSYGKIKDDNQDKIDSENYLTIELFEKDILAKTIKIEHPLFKKIEYSSGDTLKSKNLNLKSEEFFIRLQAKGDSSRIRISESLKGSATKEITIIYF